MGQLIVCAIIPIAYFFPVKTIDKSRLIYQAGKHIDKSTAGICLITDFPLEPGRVLEWDDLNNKGNLHIAMVKWARKFDSYYRAGLIFVWLKSSLPFNYLMLISAFSLYPARSLDFLSCLLRRNQRMQVYIHWPSQ